MTDEQCTTLGKLTGKIVALGLEAKPLADISSGPILSVYRFLPFGKTKVSQLEALADDFAVTLGVETVMVKRLPGETAVAVFVPNTERRKVRFQDTTELFWAKSRDSSLGLKIPLNLGIDYLGNQVIEDLTELPHLLIAGSTNAGKSTLLNCIITSLLVACSPDNIQLILSDTKGVEFTAFHGVPHLIFQPATTVRKTLDHLDFVINEMESRLSNFGTSKVKNIIGYNATHVHNKYPYIVLIFDELADITQDQTKESDDKGAKKLGKLGEEKLSYIAQKGRAAGIHMIAATQRPSVNVVNGSIKANFPARITLRLVTEADSRAILGVSGAEHLLAKGDMLYMSPNSPTIKRLHAPWTEQTDVEAAMEMAVHQSSLI